MLVYFRLAFVNMFSHLLLDMISGSMSSRNVVPIFFFSLFDIKIYFLLRVIIFFDKRARLQCFIFINQLNIELQRWLIEFFLKYWHITSMQQIHVKIITCKWGKKRIEKIGGNTKYRVKNRIAYS